MPHRRRHSVSNPHGLWQDTLTDHEAAARPCSAYPSLGHDSVGNLLHEFINLWSETRLHDGSLKGKLHISDRILRETEEYVDHHHDEPVLHIGTEYSSNLQSLPKSVTQKHGRRPGISHADLHPSQDSPLHNTSLAQTNDPYTTRKTSGQWVGLVPKQVKSSDRGLDTDRYEPTGRNTSLSSSASDRGPEELFGPDDINWDIVDELKSFSFDTPSRGRKLTRPDFPPMSPKAVACKLWPELPDFSVPLEQDDILHLHAPPDAPPEKIIVETVRAEEREALVSHKVRKPGKWLFW
ncbi:MAG: hypothetical protein Q9174_001807 [Haloplaca sp. 1 TL-2023]